MPRKPRKRELLRIADRRSKAAELYLRGMTLIQIATQLGFDITTISRDIKIMQATWLEAASQDIAEQRARELAKIDTLERAYWAEWRKSRIVDSQPVGKQAPTEIVFEATDYDPSKPVQKPRLSRIHRDGDPRYLQGVQWCIEQRVKILKLADLPALAQDGRAAARFVQGVLLDERGREALAILAECGGINQQPSIVGTARSVGEVEVAPPFAIDQSTTPESGSGVDHPACDHTSTTAREVDPS